MSAPTGRAVPEMWRLRELEVYYSAPFEVRCTIVEPRDDEILSLLSLACTLRELTPERVEALREAAEWEWGSSQRRFQTKEIAAALAVIDRLTGGGE